MHMTTRINKPAKAKYFSFAALVVSAGRSVQLARRRETELILVLWESLTIEPME